MNLFGVPTLCRTWQCHPQVGAIRSEVAPPVSSCRSPVGYGSSPHLTHFQGSGWTGQEISSPDAAQRDCAASRHLAPIPHIWLKSRLKSRHPPARQMLHRSWRSISSTPQVGISTSRVRNAPGPVCERRNHAGQSLYDWEVGRHWVLHLQRGWEVPPIKERRLLAARVREELRAREHDGRLRCAPWLFAWSSGEERSRVEIRGWDSRVPSSRQAGPTHLTAFLDSELIRKKRSKLITDSRTLDAPERQLYLFTSPTGPNAHIATTHMLELADGTFALPFDLDELWLDSRGATLRRFRRQDGWTEYIL